ncbi:gamma-glutamyl-gamma-aminobutyrate hydrolase family protein (plasmid) [Buchnera aphidicola (Ceratoglyphina bambusae)]|uniref:glutamine amidotransferase-related protein n=1 Tax=Buchnera aphidicola TaxID=9 RepID=UPI0031B8172F
MSNIFILDNLDSLTYNIAEELRVYGHNVHIHRNDSREEEIYNLIMNIKDPILLLSPGPGIPLKAGCMMKIIKKFSKKIPILGICLGHQAIIEYFNGTIKKSKSILHGRSSLIFHDNKFMYKNISNPLKVSRYHSWICDKIPKSFIINACYKNIVMSIRHNKHKICSFQFHPESILTIHGNILLKNTIKWLSE